MLMEADDDKRKRDNEKTKDYAENVFWKQCKKKRLTTGFYLAILWLYIIIIHKNWSYILNEDFYKTKHSCVAWKSNIGV